MRTPGSANQPITFREMARELADRLIRIFPRDGFGRRPVHGGSRKFQEDLHWHDYLLFFQYFHGDHGSGVGASHHTALVAPLLDKCCR